MIGWDFGLTGAIVYGQRTADGRYVILGEAHANQRGAKRFGTDFRAFLYTQYPHMWKKHRLYGDPAGDQRAQTDEETPFMVARSLGFNAIKAPTNDISIRIETVQELLGKLVDGRPALFIDPSCQMLISGMEERYRFEDDNDIPDKNDASHVQDALQYMLLGAGAGRAFLQGQVQTMRQVKTKDRSRNPYDHMSIRNRRMTTRINRLMR